MTLWYYVSILLVMSACSPRICSCRYGSSPLSRLKLPSSLNESFAVSIFVHTFDGQPSKFVGLSGASLYVFIYSSYMYFRTIDGHSPVVRFCPGQVYAWSFIRSYIVTWFHRQPPRSWGVVIVSRLLIVVSFLACRPPLNVSLSTWFFVSMAVSIQSVVFYSGRLRVRIPIDVH